MAQRLFGVEAEFAFVLFDRERRRVAPAQASEWLLEAARAHLVHLPDMHSSGVFLTNGARFYIDCGNHPEFAGPELANPWDAARYVKAGECILLELGERLRNKRSVVDKVWFYRQNVDYGGTGATWGSHESYLHKADPSLFREHLMPHLVSRLIYTGSGGFDSTYPGIRFTLSPRVPHLVTEVSPDSTHTRGVLHTKDESLSSRGYHRLHLLCSESLFSEWALFLKVGITALIVAMIEAGLRPAEQVALRAPLESMRAFAADPHCRVQVLNRRGVPVTALTIQRHYLTMAEAHLQASFMPPWAGEVCREWHRVLDLLESGSPTTAATTLDWAIRYSVFERFLADRGYTWASIREWNTVAESVGLAPGDTGFPPEFRHLEFFCDDGDLLEEMMPLFAPRGRGKGASRAGYKKFRTLRSQLCELDTRFGQLGDGGLFAQLDRAGVLQHHLPGVDNFGHAMEFPPAVGRANLRGDCVRRLGGINCSRTAYACDWAGVLALSQNRVLDLSDPFTQHADWKETSRRADLPRNRPLADHYLRIRELMERVGLE